MNVQTRRRIAAALMAVAGLVGLVYAASRFVPSLVRGMMRSGMQAMMREMMGADGACSACCSPEMCKQMMEGSVKSESKP